MYMPSRPVTLDDIIGEVRELVGEEHDANFTRDRIIHAVNLARTELFTMEEWPFLQVTNEVAVDKGESEVTYGDVPEEGWHIIKTATVLRGNERRLLRPATAGHIDLRGEQEGTPAWYRTVGPGRVQLHPTPDRDMTFIVRGYGVAQPLDVTFDGPDSEGRLPEPFVAALTFAAAASLLRLSPEAYKEDTSSMQRRAEAMSGQAATLMQLLTRTYINVHDEGIFSIGEARDWNWGEGNAVGRAGGEPASWQW